MKKLPLAKRIDAIINDFSHCMCSSREFCDICDPSGAYGRLRKAIHEEIHGKTKPMTLEDYGRSIEINLGDLK